MPWYLPTDFVLLLRFLMATIIIDVQILTRRAQGFVPEVVADEA